MKRRSTAAACLMAAAVILVGIAAFNAGWLTEKTYVRAEWNADTLLIVRTGSEAGVLIDDRAAIDALQNSLTWTNFHLECCCGAPDFWAYVYRDGEPIDVLRGFDKPGGDAYNRDFYQRLRAMGQMKPNVCVTRAEVPSGVRRTTYSFRCGTRLSGRAFCAARAMCAAACAAIRPRRGSRAMSGRSPFS